MTQDKTINPSNVVFPAPPSLGGVEEDDAVFSRFMKHLGHVPCRRMEIRVLSAIQFTADMLNLSDAHTAKTLVDMGLRAPRLAFPADYLEYADQALMRSGWQVGGPSAGLLDLKNFWDIIGEDMLAPLKGVLARLDEKTAAY